MTELTPLVERARSGDLGAYGALVRRFQDMATGYARGLTHDYQLAEDAAQDAFVRAYLDLGKLREPAAFPGWLRRIVFKQCDRITRRKGVPAVSLETTEEIVGGGPAPDAALEAKEVEDQVAFAIRDLPEDQRLVVNLFYINDFSHRDIAEFLGTPVHTVKNRLYAARNRLRQELIDMAKGTLKKARPSRDSRFVTHILDELDDLNDRGIQLLLQDTDQRDCVLALKGASDEVKHKILGNMSERVRNFVEDEVDALGDVDAAEIQQAQERIMDQLRIIRPRHRAGEKYPALKADLKKRLQEKPVSRMSLDESVEVLADLSTIASMEGMLALIEYEEILRRDEDDKLLRVGLTMTISRRGVDVTDDILEKRLHQLLLQLETRCRLIIEGIHDLQSRRSDMRAKLRARYTLSDEFIF